MNQPAQVSSTIYNELRRVAAARMRLERGTHTLQPTALVHEAYLRLAHQPDAVWKDRGQILALAARTMRHILVDHARARRASKRGAGVVQVTLDEALAQCAGPEVDVLALDEALNRLAEFDPAQARILELHFFSGLTFDEIAGEMGSSARTIKRRWEMARAWLGNQLAHLPAQ